jgi:hypothetical protein
MSESDIISVPPVYIAKLGVPKTVPLVYETIFKVRNRDPHFPCPCSPLAMDVAQQIVTFSLEHNMFTLALTLLGPS